jgi:hypothetical protein
LFWRNSGCSAEHKTPGIRFQTIPQRRKMLGILDWGTKIEENSRNFILKPFHGRDATRNSVLWNKKRSKLSEFCSEAFCQRKQASNSVCWSRIFCKTDIFHVIPFRSELRNRLFREPRNEHFLPRNNGNCSESIQGNFFRNEIPLLTLVHLSSGERTG